MKILIEESVLRQVLEALENFQRAELYDSDAWAAITALRTALDNPTPPTNTDPNLDWPKEMDNTKS